MIEIRELHSMPDMQMAAELQQIYWGDDANNIVPDHMLFTISKAGGHVFGAFDGTKLIGILVGFLGTSKRDRDTRPAMASLLIMSKRMVVLPEYRGQNIGYELKVAQRNLAIKQGIRLVTWTYDPMLAANAHLNIRKLGGVAEQYVTNYFGMDESRTKLSADRLVIDWWVTHQRVKERMDGSRGGLTLQQYLDGNASIMNRANYSAEFPHPTDMILAPSSTLALIEIPLNFIQIEEQDAQLAQSWRDNIRETFRKTMREQYAVTDFVRGELDGIQRGFYLLSLNMGFDVRLN